MCLAEFSKIYHIPSVNEDKTTQLKQLLIDEKVKTKTNEEVKFLDDESKISEMRMIKSSLRLKK